MNSNIVILLVALGIGTLALPIAAHGAELDLYHADFHARLGIRIYAQVGQVAPDVSMKAELTDDTGSTQTVFTNDGDLSAQETVTLNLRDLPAGNYTLTVSLSDGRTAVRTWKKPHNGMPTVGIDENNAICVDGAPFFPVMCKGVSREKELQKWLPTINTMKHLGFNKKLYPPEGFRVWLDLAYKHGLKATFKDQVTRLTPAVLGPDYEGTVTKREHADGRVDIKVTQAGGAIYIFAANLRPKAESVTLTLATDATAVEVVDEDRSLALDGRSFTDTFAPQAVHIYRVKKQVLPLHRHRDLI